MESIFSKTYTFIYERGQKKGSFPVVVDVIIGVNRCLCRKPVIKTKKGQIVLQRRLIIVIEGHATLVNQLE